MPYFANKYFLYFTLLLIGWILSGCVDKQEDNIEIITAANKAAQFAESAAKKAEAATDVNTILKAAEITIQSLNMLTDIIVAAPDLSFVTDAQKKFEIARFKTVRRLHTFLVPASNDCKNVLNLLIQLDSRVKKFACHKRVEDHKLFGCRPDKNKQQCQCSRNSAGTCPNNKNCMLLQDDTCKCNNCLI